MRTLFFVPFLYLSLVGCGGGRYAVSEPDTPITESLFNAADRSISEENIQKLLDGHLRLPDSLRIALYKYGTNSKTLYYSKMYALGDENRIKAQQSYVDTLTKSLIGNPNVKRVNIVPSIMLSAQPGITQLRESAVRLQSDLLLVFASTSDIYYKFKSFKKDEVKAYATTEILLMDVRTGLVPFATIVTKDFLTKKYSNETPEETRARAQSEAVLLTLAESGKRISVFLKNP